MDRQTLDVYESTARQFDEQRRPETLDDGADLGRRAAPLARPVVDIGSGPGWYSPSLGPSPVIALDAVQAMLDLVPEHAPDALRVRADMATLPFRAQSLGGAFASKCYVHLARADVPLALADLHRSLVVGAPFELVVFAGDLEQGVLDGDDFAGRRFSEWTETHLRDLVVGAGFDIESLVHEPAKRQGEWRLTATRARTLADTVGAGMRLLVVGLNPSVYSADVGHGFARPGNRFWPAATAAGLVGRPHDARRALIADRVGMTDLVKRATPRADVLTVDDYRAGFDRVARLVDWLRPAAVCVVGLAGWRAAVDRLAQPGEQSTCLGGRPVYLMPNTSGLNARSSLSDLTDHLRRAAALADSTG
jgi:double-stranded uracil-DNA glycosylase